MRTAFHFWLTLFIATAALVASAILLVDYLEPTPIFCDPNGGCQVVRQTAYAYPFGIPLPAFGIVGIVGIAVMAMQPGRLAAWVELGLAAVGAVVATLLFVVQLRLGVLCPFCVVVDTAAILLAGLAALRVRTRSEPPRTRLATAMGVTLLVLAVVGPVIVGRTRAPAPALAMPPTLGVPKPIEDELARSPKGVLTVIDFIDYECPFCRSMNATLEPLLAARKDKIRVVRKHVPLAVHPHAMGAARAGCCADELGKGAEMSNALFEAPAETLTPEGCEALARQHGLDLARFRACVANPETDARIAQDRALWKSSNGRALPTLWIGRTEIVGARDEAAIAAALDKELQAL